MNTKIKKAFLVLLAFCCVAAFPGKNITWIAIGDSITYLNDHPDETGNRVNKGYLTRVAEKLPGVRYVNQGHNGWTSGGIAAEIENLGLSKADIYTVFLGTNDWWSGRRIGAIEDYTLNRGNNSVYGSFRIIINKLRSLNPSAKIILITPMKRGDFVQVGNPRNLAWGSYRDKNGQSLADFAEAIKEIGKLEQIPVIDLYNKSGMTHKNMVRFKRLMDPASGSYRNYKYPSYIDIPFHPDKDEYPYPLESIDMTYDGLHPSDKGNAIIAKMLVKEMKKYK